MSSLTMDAVREMLAALPPRKPMCVVVFTWHLWPTDNAVQFTGPDGVRAAFELLGPYATDVVDALSRAVEGDFVWVVHPSVMDEVNREVKSDPWTAFMGIPVRELRRDPEWEITWQPTDLLPKDRDLVDARADSLSRLSSLWGWK